MLKRSFVLGGAAAVVLAALLMTPSFSLAQHGGHGGGGHGGGAAMHGGGGGSWHGGSWGGNGWRGDGWRGNWGGNRFGWGGGWGWGWPYYAGWGYGWPNYGYSSYYPYYSTEDYYPDFYADYGTGPDYYSGYMTPGSSSPPSDMQGGYYGSQSSGGNANTAFVNVVVPPNAQVTFEGQPTTQTGMFRRYQSPPLDPGKEFTYDIQARWNQNGKEVTQDRHVRVRAGQQAMVDFVRGDRDMNRTNEPLRAPTPRTEQDKFNNVPPTPGTTTTPSILPGTQPPAPGTNPTQPGTTGNPPGTQPPAGQSKPPAENPKRPPQ